MIRMLIVVLALLYPVKAAAETGYSVITEVNGDSLGWVIDVDVDSTGTLWVAAQCGLLKLKDGIWTKERSDKYESIVVDYGGKIWLRNYGENKLTHFDGSNWVQLTLPDHISDFCIAPDSTVWVAGSNVSDPRVYRYDGTTWTSYTTADGLADNRVERLSVSPTGEVWASHCDPYDYSSLHNRHAGISHFKDGTWRVYDTSSGFVSDAIYDFAFLPDSSTVVTYGIPGGAVGVTRWDGASWNTITNQYFGQLSVDKRGTLWMSSMGYIIKYDGTTVNQVFTSDSDIAIMWPRTRAAATDDGRIYAGCGGGRDRGLLVIDTTVHVEQSEERPVSFPTVAAYPNPFNPATTIQYMLPESGHAVVKVISVAGQTVATLVDNYQEKGNHTVRFDGSSLASGTYCVIITIESKMAISRVTLVK